MPRAFVGIDLGTTFTGVVVSSGGDTQIVRDPATGFAKFPSAVYYPEGAEDPVVGAPAISEAILEDRLDFLLQQFKRSMGTGDLFTVGPGRTVSAEQASTEILRLCRSMALERLPRSSPDQISWVISVPAKFGEPAKAATIRAAVAAGMPLEQVSLVLEPEAAAITAYLNRRLDLDDDDYVMLFDFGGGTLDIVIVQKLRSGLDPVIVDGGDPRLGGCDLDLAIAQRVIGGVGRPLLGAPGLRARQPLPTLDQWPASAKFTLMKEVETAKRLLCGNGGRGGATRHRLQVAFGERNVMAQLDLQQFKAAAEPFLASARAAVQRTLDLAWQRRSIRPNDISWVLLAGGTSQVLGIPTMLKEVLGEKAHITMPDDPWESIARGACAFAEDRHIILSKISGDAYGVSSSRDARPDDPPNRIFVTSYGARKCRYNALFFLRGQKVPREGQVQTFYTVENFQSLVVFDVLRGDSDDPDECQKVGSLKLSVPSLPHGHPIKCSFRIDEGNRLRVTAWDPSTSQKIAQHIEWIPADLVGPNG